MTNYDKFIETFMLMPRTDIIPFKCNAIDCKNCDAWEVDSCNPVRWWDSEFEEVKHE